MEQMLFLRNAGLERLEWSGWKADESVTGAGRTVRILGVRHERKCPLCENRGACRWQRHLPSGHLPRRGAKRRGFNA